VISADGVACVVINRSKILLLKRRNVPFISNPGIWAFVMGGIERGEDYLETAYREIKEETDIDKKQLTLLYGPKRVNIVYKKKNLMWSNNFYIFRSTTNKVKLDLENSAYRWATFDEIKNSRTYTNIFINEQFLLNKIRSGLDERKGPKRKNK
jgi:8-oxo-dGTP pyrophosphatase MutT (NUDIX family)